VTFHRRRPTPAERRARWTLIIIWGGMMIAVLVADHLHLTNHP
jgi:hypothetical protein